MNCIWRTEKENESERELRINLTSDVFDRVFYITTQKSLNTKFLSIFGVMIPLPLGWLSSSGHTPAALCFVH